MTADDSRGVAVYDELDGQVVLVTGANRGIGAAVAAALSDRGATVYAGTRDPEWTAPAGQRAVVLDVTDEAQIGAAIKRVQIETGRLDAVVNNAGVADGGDPLDEQPTEPIDRALAVDLRGPMLVCKHALPLLTDRDGGRVVNVSSGKGALGEGMGPGTPAYRVSKAGLNGLTVYLDAEYGDERLLANAVCPGWVRTDMGGPNAPRSVETGAETPTWLARFRPGSPSGLFWRDGEVIEW